VNPFNAEAGETPAPASAEERAAVESSARVIWRAFPYFAWRYGERGRSFGRSDAGYLVTLLEHDEPTARAQVAWLARLLAPRGMPSLLLEVQLESLGRTLRRAQVPGASRLRALAAELRSARLGVLDASTFVACERICRAAMGGVLRRRGAGSLIAAAVADRALGFGEHDEALVRWLAGAEPSDPRWSTACAAARALAMASRRQADLAP
jgi:hypothetical protein